jgi:hypothetical protein
LAFAMAGANAWGLLLCTLMLGYGLVEVPRTLWKSANVAWSLKRMQFESPKVKEAVVDAESEVYEVAKDISNAHRKLSSEDPLYPFMQRLLAKVISSFGLIGVTHQSIVSYGSGSTGISNGR